MLTAPADATGRAPGAGSSGPAGPLAAGSPARPRVLIADDSRLVRASLSQRIGDRFEVLHAEDGDVAWQTILLDAALRVVITDLTMPHVDGYELLRRVRGSSVERIRELPIIVVTGEEDGPERDRAAALGATEFITKGAQAAEVVSRLDVLVRLSAARDALAESRATLAAVRTHDAGTNLLRLPFFDRQVERQLSRARRTGDDVAVICIRVGLSSTEPESWGPDAEERLLALGRLIADAVRLEDLATRSDRFEFSIGAQTTSTAGLVQFASRLRSLVESPGGDRTPVVASLGVARLLEDPGRDAAALRALAARRAAHAQSSKVRRIVLDAADTAARRPRPTPPRALDLPQALALLREGRASEVLPHLPELLAQIAPLVTLARQARQSENNRGRRHEQVPGVPSSLDRRA